MYNNRVAIHGLMGFKDVDLDLSDLQGKIIAIVGENGAGKSTLLESIGYAGLYRTFPSREQGIHKYCKGEAYIENDFLFNGNQYKTKILINSAGTRVEAYLFENGIAVNDGKTGTFDKAAAQRFGSGELILSSVFSAQNSVGSFLELPRPKRKDLFISMLNLGILQDVSSYAGDMTSQYASQENDLSIKLQSLKTACSVNIPDKESLSKKQALLESCILDRETERDKVKDQASVISKSIQDQMSIAKTVGLLNTSINVMERNKIESLKKLNSAKTELLNHSPISDDITSRLELEASMISTYEAEKDSKEIDLSNLERTANEKKIALTNMLNKAESIQKEISNTIKLKDKCIKDASLLQDVPCGGAGEFASCRLIKNSVDQNNLIPCMRDRLEVLSKDLSGAKADIKPLETIDDDFSQVKLDILDLKHKIKASREANAVLLDNQAKQNKVVVLRQLIDELVSTIDEASSNIRVKVEERDEISKGLSSSLDEEYSELLRAVASLNGDIAHCRSELHQVIMDLGKVDVLKKNVESAVIEAAKIQAELDHIHKDKLEWGQIEYAFGPKAIQALEIDSAGPWVSDIINDLLRSCFGSRFSINLITQAMKANKSGMKDFFDIEVVDSEKNRTGLVNDLSGGEKVICSEAISLAIALYNGNVGGVKWDTLYRDECSGALSPKNALLYIKMLRRAIELGKFKRCFFIAHQPELVDASDNQVIICDGKITTK